jgi:hypothetical protein
MPTLDPTPKVQDSSDALSDTIGVRYVAGTRASHEDKTCELESSFSKRRDEIIITAIPAP